MSSENSFSTEVSERYALALFELAKESDELEDTVNQSKTLIQIYEKDFNFKKFISDPTITIENQKKIFSKISDLFNFSKNFKNFLYILIQKRRTFILIKILKNILKKNSIFKGNISARLTSADQLSENDKENIKNQLGQSLSKKIELEFVVDKELLSGLKLQIGSLLIDTSISSKLSKYKQSMIKY